MLDLKKSKPLRAQSEAKFGTGVYAKDFGNVRVSAATILYVPFILDFSW